MSDIAAAAPVFVSTDPQAIVRSMTASYEQATGQKLYPAQVEQLLINLFAYRESLLREAINTTARQNLVSFASAPMLDYLGELVGTYRLPATAASTRLRFSLDEPAPRDLIIPAGTRVAASTSIIFATDTETVIRAGTTNTEVTATCSEQGNGGNGWQPAQISTLLDAANDDVRVSNLTQSAGGSDAESDDRLRERIKLAPEAFSNAGSRGAYHYHVLTVHQSIIDVAISRPVPGTVQIVPLLDSGLPDDDMIRLIAAHASGEKLRPLTDTVIVLKPAEIPVQISATITPYPGTIASEVLAAARESITDYIRLHNRRLAQDIVPSQIVAALSVKGVYQVKLSEPVTRRVVSANEWSHWSLADLLLAEAGDE